MNKWESILVSPDTKLEAAIAVLDREGLRIVLVVDRARRLLGTLTDGDVRRALLRRVSMDAPVADAMFAAPQVALRGWNKQRILALMEQQGLLQVPIVDDEQRVVGMETLHGLLQKRHRDNPVFIMAGGLGSRLQPLTDGCPKPLLKIGQKPILELIVENFVTAGFHRFFISTHYMPHMIRDHMGDGSRWGVQIRYVHEEQPLGTAGALGLLPHDEIDLPLLMMNGDLLTNLNFHSLLAFHETHASAATMCVREYEHRVPYGVVESDGHRISSMIEKPVHRYFINAGIYLLQPEILPAVAPGRRVDMPELLQEQIAQGRSVNVFPIHEYWLDIGRIEDFQRAQTEIAKL